MKLAAGSLTKEHSRAKLGVATLQAGSKLPHKKQLLSDASRNNLSMQKSDTYVFEGGVSLR